MRDKFAQYFKRGIIKFAYKDKPYTVINAAGTWRERVPFCNYVKHRTDQNGNSQSGIHVHDGLLSELLLDYHNNMQNEKRTVIEKTVSNPEAWMRIVVMEIDHYAESKRVFKDSYGSLLEAIIENILSELLEGINHIQMIEKEGRSILNDLKLLFHFEMDSREIEAC